LKKWKNRQPSSDVSSMTDQQMAQNAAVVLAELSNNLEETITT
jgi:hypothetical protein